MGRGVSARPSTISKLTLVPYRDMKAATLNLTLTLCGSAGAYGGARPLADRSARSVAHSPHRRGRCPGPTADRMAVYGFLSLFVNSELDPPRPPSPVPKDPPGLAGPRNPLGHVVPSPTRVVTGTSISDTPRRPVPCPATIPRPIQGFRSPRRRQASFFIYRLNTPPAGGGEGVGSSHSRSCVPAGGRLYKNTIEP